MNTFPKSQAKFYASQIVVTLDYLHNRGIIFRDIKPENILINSDGYIKFMDFGFSKQTDGKTYTLCGTPNYTAPEVLMSKGHSKSVDWWSFGVLLYEMAVGIDPFADEDIMNVYSKILKCQVVYPQDLDSKVKSLVKHLLVTDVSKRYGVNDVYNHRFFKDVDWGLLVRKKVLPEYVPKIK
jgi:protein kinase X